MPNNFPNIKILGPWIGLHDKYEPGVYRWRDGSLLSDSDHTAWSVGHPKVSKGKVKTPNSVFVTINYYYLNRKVLNALLGILFASYPLLISTTGSYNLCL